MNAPPLEEPRRAAGPKRVVPRWRKALPLLGLLLFGWVLSRLDLHAMGAAIARVSVATLVLSCGAFTCNCLLKACRWHRLLRAQGIAVPWRITLAAFLSGQFYGQVTLGRVGEFFRVEALLERGVSAGAALASSVFDRVLDLFLVLLSAGVLSVLVLGDLRIALLTFVLMVAGAFAVRGLLLTLGAPELAQGRIKRAFDAWSGRKWLGRIAKLVRDLAQGMYPMVRVAPLSEAMLWTSVSWCFYYTALFALADGLGLHVPRVLLTATAAFAALSALLPVTISGLGARELIYISVLKSHGVPGEAAAVLSLLHLFVMTASATSFGLLGVIWRQRQKL